MNHAKMQRVFARVLTERARQDDLKATGKFLYTCADAELSHVECSVVLGEEYGEVCRAVLNLKGLSTDFPRGETTAKVKYVQQELVQVAAVACAWLESMELEPTEGIQR